MNAWLRCCIAAILLAASAAPMASFHLFRIDQVFSNADGSVQFVVMRESFGANGEHFWAGLTLVSAGNGTVRTFTFPTDLPGSQTAGRRVLVATEGFAALGLVTPDYRVPNGFFATRNGTLNFANVDQIAYASLPSDGVTAIDRNGSPLPNVATNFAGQSASLAALAVELNQHGLTGSWYEPATAGQGLEVEVFPDLSAPGRGLVQVSWFTHDTIVGGAERQRWYTLSGPVVTGEAVAALTIYRNTGGRFDAPPVTVAEPVGTATLSFDTCTSGRLTYAFADGSGRTGTVELTRLTQNVTCSTTAARPLDADFALSGNWFAPPTSGQGLTIEVNPVSAVVFAAWYTYASAGTGSGAAGQRWYTAQSSTFVRGSRSIPVTLYETTGGVFDAPSAPLPATVPVGTGTIAFPDCASATLDYAFTAGSNGSHAGRIALMRVGPVPPGCT